jgi:hypothetical protein
MAQPQLKSTKDNRMTVKGKKDKNYLYSGFHGMLIATKGYENVIIGDIAKAAVMIIGLTYKYFPGSKFDILKEISSQYTGELLMTKKPENINFNDSSGKDASAQSGNTSTYKNYFFISLSPFV